MFDSLARRNRRNVPLPEGIDWSRRANPAIRQSDDPYERTDARSVALGRNKLAAENATYLRLKLMRLGGEIIGFHGTTAGAAAQIMSEGFKDSRHVESRRLGVSAWDSVVAYEALRFARERAAEAGEEGRGKIIEVQMIDPHEDSWHGRLEWLAKAKATTPLEVYSPEDFKQYIGQLAIQNPGEYDTRDPYAEGL
jgi:hypothetical protein